jgi:hypothetical protein
LGPGEDGEDEGMRRPLTKEYLARLKQVVYAKEANALTDRDAERTDIDTDVLLDLIAVPVQRIILVVPFIRYGGTRGILA